MHAEHTAPPINLNTAPVSELTLKKRRFFSWKETHIKKALSMLYFHLHVQETHPAPEPNHLVVAPAQVRHTSW